MSLDDAEIKAIQAANDKLQEKMSEMVTDLYRQAAKTPVIACGQCHEPTASLSARVKTIIPDDLFGTNLYPDIKQVKLALVCPRCFDLP